MNLRLGYMTALYPRATDTFIQREVATLRALGHYVQTFSVRRTPLSEHVSERIVRERDGTIYLLPPRALVRAHLQAFFASPSRYGKALALAVRTCAPGLRAKLKQTAYFLEAGMLVARMREQSLTHLHNHFGDASCSVAAIAAEMGGFSFSFTIHGSAEFFELSRWRLDEKVRRARFVICISHFCRSQMMIVAPVENWDKLRLVRCGVDVALFPVKSHVGRGRRLLFIGRLAPEKGCPILLEALAQIPDVILDIVGDGPSRAALPKRAQELGIADRIVFHGYMGEDGVRARLAEADVFVLASFAEGLPIVLMEALAAGVPAVATQIAGIPELIEDDVTGFLVPAADADALAQATRRLIEDPALRNRIAAAGRERVEREFDLETQCRRLEGVMAQALLEDSGAPRSP